METHIFTKGITQNRYMRSNRCVRDAFERCDLDVDNDVISTRMRKGVREFPVSSLAPRWRLPSRSIGCVFLLGRLLGEFWRTTPATIIVRNAQLHRRVRVRRPCEAHVPDYDALDASPRDPLVVAVALDAVATPLSPVSSPEANWTCHLGRSDAFCVRKVLEVCLLSPHFHKLTLLPFGRTASSSRPWDACGSIQSAQKEG